MKSDPVASNLNQTYTVTPTVRLTANSNFKVKVLQGVKTADGGELQAEYITTNGFTTHVSEGFSISAISGNTTEVGAGTATFTISLDSPPDSSVTIAVSSSDETEGTASPTSLSFTTDNWNGTQTVTVTGVDDSLADGDITYSVVLGAATSFDTLYSGLNPSNVTVTNTDNETAGFTISAISGNTTEAGLGTATFTVKLNSPPTGDVMIPLSSSDETEGTITPNSLNFTSYNWAGTQTVTVTGVDDSLADGDIIYSIILGAITSFDSYNELNPADVSVSNTDNETAGFTISAISGNTTEAGGTATFTVKLNSQPIDDVVIPLSSSDETEGTVSPTSLTFTNGNWASGQTVVVTGVDDSLTDGNIVYSIVLGAVTSSDTYNGLNPASVWLTNIDNEPLTILRGLMWQDSGYTTQHNWQSAVNYCSALSLEGHVDWRLPSITELETLFPDRYQLNSFSYGKYWSATTYAPLTTSAWNLDFYITGNGTVNAFSKFSSLYIRCVR